MLRIHLNYVGFTAASQTPGCDLNVDYFHFYNCQFFCVCVWVGGIFCLIFSLPPPRFLSLVPSFFFLFLHVRLWLKGKVPRLQLAAPPRPALIYPSKVHTHRHTHTPSSSLVTDLCQPCALSWCSASAHVLQFPHIQTLYVFLIIFPPPSETLLPYLIEKITVGSITYTGC